MKSFPETLGVIYKNTFQQRNYEYKLGLLRKEIYELILNAIHSNFVDLDNFCRTKLEGDKEVLCEMVDTVTTELEGLGWSVNTSYGGTALFVYVGDKPKNCYDDSII